MRFSELLPGDLITDEVNEVVLVCSVVGLEMVVMIMMDNDIGGGIHFLDWTGTVIKSIEDCGWRGVWRDGRNLL